ncbi:hypothetical protein DFJ67_0244 [Asanoa ferruginea]|uniref:RanBP2-type domain-containing protein n=1 Tax=Asanoa ferruginea TaxID=53367 RepID=A0A3D9ZAP1_9ACTN|nr:Ran-binding zinc finger domain-containing protein [Asanoa ferruginea]REF94327.1 hypothetical protein DFJ67_0244 [Asanoa ferruginea]GIF52307.1 hypothetical protein Afe04nite_68460 [Asanoa ferruginea]
MTPWQCGECGRRNEPLATTCAVCGNPADEPAADPVNETAPAPATSYEPLRAYQPAARVRRQRGPLIAGIAALALLVLAGGGWYAGVHERLTASPEATSTTTVAPPDTAPTFTTAPVEPTIAPPPQTVGMVTIHPAVTDERAPAVAALFDGYFSAINAHNAEQAVAAFDPAGNIAPTDADAVAKFATDISTTWDSDVVLMWLGDNGPGAVQAQVTFTSRQDPYFGPTGRESETCTLWDITYLLTQPAGAHRIHSGSATSTPC